MTLKALSISTDELNVEWILGPELVPVLQRSSKPPLRACLFLRPIPSGNDLQEQPIQVLDNSRPVICDLNDDLKEVELESIFCEEIFLKN